MAPSKNQPSSSYATVPATREYHCRPPMPRRGRQGTIVDTLLRRSVTGHRLSMELHRHNFDRLHIVWKNNDVEKDLCIERQLLWVDSIFKFREMLTLHPIEGTCTCVVLQQVCTRDKTSLVPCTRGISGRYQGYCAKTCEMLGLCRCPVTYSEQVFNLV